MEVNAILPFNFSYPSSLSLTLKGNDRGKRRAILTPSHTLSLGGWTGNWTDPLVSCRPPLSHLEPMIFSLSFPSISDQRNRLTDRWSGISFLSFTRTIRAKLWVSAHTHEREQQPVITIRPFVAFPDPSFSPKETTDNNEVRKGSSR